jgi:hypothetical protein
VGWGVRGGTKRRNRKRRKSWRKEDKDQVTGRIPYTLF